MGELNDSLIQANGFARRGYLKRRWLWRRTSFSGRPGCVVKYAQGRVKNCCFILCLGLLLACRLAHALDPNRKISQYAHSAWRMQDGYFPGFPMVMTQTTDGYIWIGTKAGILKFDGVRFVPWSPPGEDKLRSPEVHALRGTRDGSLWIGIANGLWQWKNQRLTSYPDLTSSLITDILEDDGGTVWVTRARLQDGSGQVCEVGQGHSRCYILLNDASNYGLYDLAEDSHGNLWLGGSAAFVKWRPRSPVKETYRISGSVPNASSVHGLALGADGSVWIGIDMPGRGLGLEHFVNGNLSSLKTEHWDSSSTGVNRLLRDSHGVLWAATFEKGVYRIQIGVVDHFGSADGLTGDAVKTLFEDREGDIWAATTKGIDCFRDLAVATLSMQEGLGTQEVNTVMASRDGTIWAGGARSLDALKGGSITSFRTGKNLPGEEITSLLEDREGRLWVGIDHTMSVLKNGRFVPVKRPDGSPLGFVVGMAEDTEENIWAEATNKPRALIRLRDFQVKEILPSQQMPAARKVSADPRGGIWLGLMNGDLARYRDGKLDTFQFLHREGARVSQVDAGADGSVLGATPFGLLGWRQGMRQILTVQNGLPCDGVNSFIRDNQGGMWLSLQCGLVRISSQDFQKWWGQPGIKLPLHVFDALDGVQPGLAPFQGAARSPDGKLWFVNGSVLQVIDPAHLPYNSLPPPVHVEELQADAKRLQPNAHLELPALTRDLVIRYTALSYVAPQKVFFRYILEGQDKKWQDAGTHREAFYTNLGPGSYRFHVVACNNDGLWNETGAALDFSIAPAFYQTVWFKLLCLMAVAGILWLLYFLRMRQVAAGAQARLEERLEERERIARELHDTLLQGVQGIILRFQGIANQMANGDSTREMMEQVLDRADEVLLEGRQRVRNLRSEEPSVELSEALALCAREFVPDRTVDVSVNAVGTPLVLNAIVREEAFRIGREALVNARQHSGASLIEAEIIYESANMHIRVRDNGCGIDSVMLNGGRPGHWGISGMRERARKIGAQLNIWSSPRAGTEIELIIPANLAYRHSQSTRRKY
jgi:signal transduction histidine kinase/ligand-binding sensor domain-containing protein